MPWLAMVLTEVNCGLGVAGLPLSAPHAERGAAILGGRAVRGDTTPSTPMDGCWGAGGGPHCVRVSAECGAPRDAAWSWAPL